MYVCKYGHSKEPLINSQGAKVCRICNCLRVAEYAKKNMSKIIDSRYFGGNREAAIIRDGEKCVDCGMTRQDHKERYNRDITVDHIDGNGRGRFVKDKNNELDNLATLCLPCHGRKDGARRITHGSKYKKLAGVN